MNSFLQSLIDNPLVYYVYQRGSLIYGCNTKDSDKDYLVITNEEYKVPNKYKQYLTSWGNVQIEDLDFMFIGIQDWFSMVLDNKIPTWECAFLNKRFIFKEYVKLNLELNTVKLIKNLIVKKKSLTESSDYKEIWYFIKDLLFAQQIIDCHKIIDFKEANKYRESLKSADPELRYNFAISTWNKFYDKNKGFYESYIKSTKLKKCETDT